uniref:Large ribosomal subunit protein mL52 n=1 Tax=Homalodisca liturata TaxID=320908 RepID=A0A1B6JRW4_9HEMI
MNIVTLLNKSKVLLQRGSVCHVSKAELNTRRKTLRTRFCLEPRRRISAIFDNPNATSALRDGPDYTFRDNRPTPYGIMQYKRICQSIEHTAAIIRCNKEIDLALQLEKRQAEELQAEVKSILDKKLKPKGGKVEANRKKR